MPAVNPSIDSRNTGEDANDDAELGRREWPFMEKTGVTGEGRSDDVEDCDSWRPGPMVEGESNMASCSSFFLASTSWGRRNGFNSRILTPGVQWSRTGATQRLSCLFWRKLAAMFGYRVDTWRCLLASERRFNWRVKSDDDGYDDDDDDGTTQPVLSLRFVGGPVGTKKTGTKHVND